MGGLSNGSNKKTHLTDKVKKQSENQQKIGIKTYKKLEYISTKSRNNVKIRQ